MFSLHLYAQLFLLNTIFCELTNLSPLHVHALFPVKIFFTEKPVDKINAVCYYNISNNYYYQKDEENVKV